MFRMYFQHRLRGFQILFKERQFEFENSQLLGQ